MPFNKKRGVYVDLKEYNPGRGDKLIIHVGDENNEPTCHELGHIREMFESFNSNKCKILLVPYFVKVTIIKNDKQ